MSIITHYFSAIRTHLPRAELSRRAVMQKELEAWEAQGNAGSLKPDHCRLLREATHCLESACAYYDGEAFTLNPGEQAVIPAVWSNLPLCVEKSDSAFLCAGLDRSDNFLEVLPGLCDWKERDLMLLSLIHI